LRNKALWKTLGEKLHPGDFAVRFPQTFAAFQILRNNEAFLTFAGKVEKLFSLRILIPLLRC
jgi:hypothetical protein